MKKMDRHVSDFVADDFAEEVGVFTIVESGMDANVAGLRIAAPEGSTQTRTRFDLNAFRQIVDQPQGRPFADPDREFGAVHVSANRAADRFYATGREIS
jgi:hypothetical protein